MSTTPSLYSEAGTIVQHAPEEDESMRLSDLVIEVEDQKFKIRRDFFGDFELNIFNSTPEYDELGAERPLRLEGIDKVDFLNFLKYVNTRHKRGQADGTNSAACRSILKLSTKWKLAQIRAAAIRDFAAVDTVQKIVLAREFFVTEWLVPALTEYVRQNQLITMENVRQLGTDYILKIVHLRDTVSVYGYNAEIERRRVYNITPHLQASFAKEIKESAYQDPKDFEPLSDDFYLMDLYFLVEDCLFKSYRQYFEVSPAFRKIFAVPVPSNVFPVGSSKSQPLHLKGIMKEDFSLFLKLTNARVQEEASFPISGWISILKLSTMWDFITMRRRAIREIEQISMANARKIHVARSCHVQQWLLPALCAYTLQEEPLTAEDVDLLGWDYVLKIIEVRRVFNTGRYVWETCRHGVVESFQGEIKKIAKQEKDLSGISGIGGMDIAEEKPEPAPGLTTAFETPAAGLPAEERELRSLSLN